MKALRILGKEVLNVLRSLLILRNLHISYNITLSLQAYRNISANWCVPPPCGGGGAVTLSQHFANEFISLSPLLLTQFYCKSWLHLSVDCAGHSHFIGSINIREALLTLSGNQSFFDLRCFTVSQIFQQTVIFSQFIGSERDILYPLTSSRVELPLPNAVMGFIRDKGKRHVF